MRPVFTNANLETEFQREGYVKVPFLSADEVEQLTNAYFDSLSQSGGFDNCRRQGFKRYDNV